MRITTTLVLLALSAVTCRVWAKDVPYVPTSETVVAKMLEMADVNESDLLYDLGCGDGRIVIAAARDCGAKGVGVDIDPARIKECSQNARSARVTEKVSFCQGNLFEIDLSPATVVTLYLLPSVNLRLRPKLFEQLKPGTRVVSHDFDMGDWLPDEKIDGLAYSVYFWVMPANFSGVWQWRGVNGQENSLHLRQTFQNVSGTWTTADTTYDISDVNVIGTDITFKVNREMSNTGGQIEAAGKMVNGKLACTFKAGQSSQNEIFQAVRKPGTKVSICPDKIENAPKDLTLNAN